uniref:Uncharacterized protein n=1 Tax=Vespula pensylvanica TaxID=30213 RepID=A0A834UGY7_VESPE|nr:hypothetical protein H0235_000978 [Vespula pensylvanica]
MQVELEGRGEGRRVAHRLAQTSTDITPHSQPSRAANSGERQRERDRERECTQERILSGEPAPPPPSSLTLTPIPT